MSSFTVSGLAEFQLDLQNLMELPDEVLMEMGEASAEVVVRKIQKKGHDMGVEDTGVTLGSIKAKKPVRKPDGVTVTVTPIGKNKDGNRNGEVAFINNYGKTNVNDQSPIKKPGRPFFTEGAAEAENEAVEAAEKVYNRYLDSKNL